MWRSLDEDQVVNADALGDGVGHFPGPVLRPTGPARGAQFTPWSTDPAELAAYTLGTQLLTPFRFTASVRVALREYAPDLLALPGPGNTLGGVCGQVIVAEGYKGVRSRDEFERVQAGADPVVWSMRR